MIKKNLRDYAAKHWNKYLRSVTELSVNKNTNCHLVTSFAQMYDFDKICYNIFSGKNIPASTDGIDFTSHSVQLVEFKSGFKKKITRDNLDEKKACCEKTGVFCEDYWNLFFKNQKKETAQLIASIRFKALESYLTLEKKILPLCQDTEQEMSMVFLVVIDTDPVVGMEDILSELSGQKRTKDIKENILVSVRKSLSSLTGLLDTTGDMYCYDKIEVLSCQDYANKLRLQNR